MLRFLHRLQVVKNRAGGLVSRTKRHKGIIPLLLFVIWLPDKLHIDFKTLLLTFTASPLNRPHRGCFSSWIEDCKSIEMLICPNQMFISKLEVLTKEDWDFSSGWWWGVTGLNRSSRQVVEFRSFCLIRAEIQHNWTLRWKLTRKQ